MPNYQLLQDLLPYLEKFELEHKSQAPTVTDFQVWLHKQVVVPTTLNTLAAPAAPEVDGEIARYVSALNRYAKVYIKKALANTELTTIDDFGYLIYLMEEGSTSKTDLIHKNIHDIPSGTEIIKRLIKKGWIDEIPDATDKRKVQVNINERGRAVLLNSFAEIRKVSKIISANLTAPEKEQLLLLLKKLDAFHLQLYATKKGKSLDEMLEL